MATERPPSPESIAATLRPVPIVGPITEYPVEEQWVSARVKPLPLVHVRQFGAPFQVVTKQGRLVQGRPGDYLAVGSDGYPFVLTPTQMEGEYEFAESATDDPSPSRPSLRPPGEVEQDLKSMLGIVGRLVKDHQHAQPPAAPAPADPEPDGGESEGEAGAEPPIPPDPPLYDEETNTEAGEPTPPWSRGAVPPAPAPPANPPTVAVSSKRLESNIQYIEQQLKAATDLFEEAISHGDMAGAAKIKFGPIRELENSLANLLDAQKRAVDPHERFQEWVTAHPEVLPGATPPTPAVRPPPAPPAAPVAAPPVSPPPAAAAPHVGTVTPEQAALIDEFVEQKMVAGEEYACGVSTVYYGYAQYVNRKAQKAIPITEFSEYLKSSGWKRVESKRGQSMWSGWTLQKLAVRPSTPGMSPNGATGTPPTPPATPGSGGEAPASDSDVPPPPPAPPPTRVGGPASK